MGRLASSCGRRLASGSRSSTSVCAWSRKGDAKINVLDLPVARATLSHQLALLPRASAEVEVEISLLHVSCACTSLSHKLPLTPTISCHVRSEYLITSVNDYTVVGLPLTGLRISINAPQRVSNFTRRVDLIPNRRI